VPSGSSYEAIMASITPAPELHGIYPLTFFDDMSTESAVVMGWLVEGILDLDLISAALDRLLTKWPLLAGRLEPTLDNRVRATNI